METLAYLLQSIFTIHPLCEGTAECSKGYRGECGSPLPWESIWKVHAQGQGTSSGIKQEECQQGDIHLDPEK